jgi:hypothetical protein
MATLFERAQDATDPTLISRTQQALVKWVIYRFGSGNATDADKRLGKQVLANPSAFARIFAVGVAQSDFWKGGTNSDPAPNTTQGDAALSSTIEGTLWPIYVTETP